MNSRMTRCAAMVATLFVLSAAYCHAATVTDWRTYKASPATTLAGQGTEDPVVGNAANPAAASFVIGYLDSPAVLGSDVGDTVTFSFGVSFTDAAGFANQGDNFRFGIFDLNGEAEDSATGGVSSGPNYATAGSANTDNFRGYMIGHRGGGGAGAGGSFRERIAMLLSGQNAFAVTGANAPTAPSLGSIGGVAIPLAADGTVYNGVLTLTRNLSGLVDVSGSFKAASAASGNTFSATDLTPNASSSYGAIGFLIGGPLAVDQANFIDVDVTAIPEPASVLLLVSGAAVLLLSRRRATN